MPRPHLPNWAAIPNCSRFGSRLAEGSLSARPPGVALERLELLERLDTGIAEVDRPAGRRPEIILQLSVL